MMDHQKKLDFVLRMTKQALEHVQHFDSGGTVLGGPVTVGTQNAVNPASQGLFGAIGNFLGTNNNFQATGTQINPGTNTAQLNQSYQGVQNGLDQSQALLGQNQNVINTLNPGLNQGANSQDFLTAQLQNQVLGNGPNPAQAALNQNTGQNINQAAALAASVRGAGSNPGLIAQQAAAQAANTQQQAVGQAATLKAQQQLGAQNALQGLAAQQVGQGVNATQLQNTAVQNQNNALQNEQNILQNANSAANQQAVSQQENINNVNSGVAGKNQESNSWLGKGIGNAVNSLGGGVGKLFAEGGKILPTHLKEMARIYHPHLLAEGGEVSLKDGGKVPGKPIVNHDSYQNDTVPARVSPGEVVMDLNTLKDKGKLGKMARFVAQEIERKKRGRKLK